MRTFVTKNLVRLAAAVAIMLAALPAVSFTAQPALADDNATNQATSAVSGDLVNKGDWIAYSVNYPGTNKDVQVTLSYSPANMGADQNVIMKCYNAPSVPPTGKVVATPQASSPGVKKWVFKSSVSGSYIVFIQNWDALGRSVHYSLSTKWVATNTEGPTITEFSKPAAAVTATTEATATATTAQTTTNTANSTTVSGDLATKGAWAAYTMNYTLKNTEAKVVVDFSPAEKNADGILSLKAFKPSSPPPAGAAIATGTSNGKTGFKYWTLNSGVTGSYVLLVQNWDGQGRSIHYTINSSYKSGSGPALALMSSGQ